jgi:four helix bundle protein
MSLKFRDWQIYKDLREFRHEVIKEILPKIPKEEKFEIVTQLKRALNSTVLNIAEGAYRKSDKDLAHFLNQADTSLNEVIACFDICLDDNYIDENLHRKFIEKTKNLTAQLTGFRKFLKKS